MKITNYRDVLCKFHQCRWARLSPPKYVEVAHTILLKHGADTKARNKKWIDSIFSHVAGIIHALVQHGADSGTYESTTTRSFVCAMCNVHDVIQ